MTTGVQSPDVPVFRTTSDRPFEAQLVVGVGLRDEPPHLLGITHLVEHLVFRAAGDLMVPHNGGTEDSHTWFQAQGETELVVEALHRIAAAFDPQSWDEADLEREKRIIAVEAGSRFEPSRGVATTRFGVGSIGNSDAGAPTAPSLTWEEVTRWARRWFVAGNAAVVLHGESAADLRLPLPPSSVGVDRSPLVERLSGGRMVASDKTGVAFSLMTSREDAPELRDALEHALLAELRGRHALVYSVDPSLSTDLRDGRYLLGFALDSLTEDTAEVARRTVEELRRRAAEGFEETSLKTAQLSAMTALRDPIATKFHAEDAAIARVLGLSPPLDPRAELDRVENRTRADLTRVLREALPTLHVLVDEEADGVDEELAERLGLAWDDGSIWHPHRQCPRPRPARRFRGRGLYGGLLEKAAVTDDWLWFNLAGDRRRIAFSEIVVAGRFGSGDIALIDHHGRSTVVEVDGWRRSDHLRETLLARLPPEVIRDYSWFDAQRERTTAADPAGVRAPRSPA